MKFAIITHTIHKKKNNNFYAYEPYVREINLWLKYVSEVKILAPIDDSKIRVIDSIYTDSIPITLEVIPAFNIISLKNKFLSIFRIPLIMLKILKVCFWADHIHIRCPGNIGLLGSFVQVFFPHKIKTVKYAGNWDPESKQPLSYILQKKILSNTFFTRNCKVLVYGKWKNQTKNILPFFTATYNEDEKKAVYSKVVDKKVRLIFVGNFSESKQPLKSVLVAEKLKNKGYDVELNMFGNGVEYNNVLKYIEDKRISDFIHLKGNKSKNEIKTAFQKSNFLVFVSKSEGWPKVIAEAMFWGCLPISSKISCIPYMLDFGRRGKLTSGDVNEIVIIIESYISNKEKYLEESNLAKKWSQQFTLEKFQESIKRII